MIKKHQAELTVIAEKTYDFAAYENLTYIKKTYRKNHTNTLSNQVEDFHIITDTAAFYLMGNAIAKFEEFYWNDNPETLNTHIRKLPTMSPVFSRLNRSRKANHLGGREYGIHTID